MSLVLLATALSWAQSSKGDEAAIRKIVITMEKGWNAASGPRFASVFAKDADYVVVNGMHIKSRATIDKAHQAIFDGIYKGSVNKSTFEDVRFVRRDIAVAHVSWVLKLATGETNRARSTIVAVKSGGKWEIAAFHNTSIVQVQTPSKH